MPALLALLKSVLVEEKKRGAAATVLGYVDASSVGGNCAGGEENQHFPQQQY